METIKLISFRLRGIIQLFNGLKPLKNNNFGFNFLKWGTGGVLRIQLNWIQLKWLFHIMCMKLFCIIQLKLDRVLAKADTTLLF